MTDKTAKARQMLGVHTPGTLAPRSSENGPEQLLALPKHAILANGAPAERATEDAL